MSVVVPPTSIDQGLVALGEEGGAPHGVGRPGGEGVDRVGLRHLGQHHGAVVLGEVERRRDAARAQRLSEGPRGLPGQLDEAGVEERRVLALEESDAAEPVREGDGDTGAFLLNDGGGLLLARGVQRREHRRDGHRADPRVADAPRGRAHPARVEGDQGAAVELVAALQHHHLRAH
jgi:hypothetical protein